MTRLSVNINKIATLRNARGGNNPDVLQVAKDCERFGAQGITVHPRPDERHIRRQDVRQLKPIITTEFNIEGNPEPQFIDLVLETRPTQVTLVPDSHEQLTSNHGWDTRTNLQFLSDVTARFHEAGIRVSIFIDAEEEMADYAQRSGADRVELYTEPYATAYSEAAAKFCPNVPAYQADTISDISPDFEAARNAAIATFLRTAEATRQLGLGLNAGHDLSLLNLAYFHKRIPWTDEVSIGHALISDALYLGLQETISRYLACLA